MTRYFHLYADGKRVHEISGDEFADICLKWRHSQKPRRLMAVSESGVWYEYGKRAVWIPLRQLLEVLKTCGVIKDEG